MTATVKPLSQRMREAYDVGDNCFGVEEVSGVEALEVETTELHKGNINLNKLIEGLYADFDKVSMERDKLKEERDHAKAAIDSFIFQFGKEAQVKATIRAEVAESALGNARRWVEKMRMHPRDDPLVERYPSGGMVLDQDFYEISNILNGGYSDPCKDCIALKSMETTGSALREAQKLAEALETTGIMGEPDGFTRPRLWINPQIALAFKKALTCASCTKADAIKRKVMTPEEVVIWKYNVQPTGTDNEKAGAGGETPK